MLEHLVMPSDAVAQQSHIRVFQRTAQQMAHHPIIEGRIICSGANQHREGYPYDGVGRMHGIRLWAVHRAIEKTRATVLAGLALGRSSQNYAQAKFPPISLEGILFGRRPDKGAPVRVFV